MKVSFQMFLYCLKRHHMDAGNSDSNIKQRRPTLVTNCPKLGSGSLAGATLLCCSTGDLVHHTTSHHHTPALSPAGSDPPGLQSQGEICIFYSCLLFVSQYGSQYSITILTLLLIFQVIYISRNPKDVVVSFYHFHKMANFLPEAGSFPEFLNRFLEGRSELEDIFYCENMLTSTLQPRV